MKTNDEPKGKYKQVRCASCQRLLCKVSKGLKGEVELQCPRCKMTQTYRPVEPVREANA